MNSIEQIPIEVLTAYDIHTSLLKTTIFWWDQNRYDSRLDNRTPRAALHADIVQNFTVYGV